MQNFHFHGRKEKGAYTPFTAPYFAFVRLGRLFTRFSICSNRAFCCSVRVALSFVSSRTTVTNDPPLSVPFCYTLHCFFKE